MRKKNIILKEVFVEFYLVFTYFQFQASGVNMNYSDSGLLGFTVVAQQDIGKVLIIPFACSLSF